MATDPDHGARRAPARQARGRMAHLSGAAAEERVAALYVERGYDVAARRWRGKAGEIDLILRKDGEVIVVEVKQGRDFDRALARLNERQIARIFRAAEEFAGKEPAGLLTELRFDVALVDGTGMVRIMENALAG